MTVEGIPCPEPGCEGTIEDGYCDITGLAYSADERYRLVDLANDVRPRTLT
ncbi:hypothetical protein MXD63_01195 [Frankia sp. Cpl3]|uniref:tetratricopeptide repeat protein n=1 Tax=Parafrankia colletiae TaxID=573497 RepID=UPI0012FFB60F|nr:tetratricopeptide repeat protein [Parafrankia colletiae]MCK9898698.1 hypothetical protein [Frankia sp. Cpl3]